MSVATNVLRVLMFQLSVNRPLIVMVGRVGYEEINDDLMGTMLIGRMIDNGTVGMETGTCENVVESPSHVNVYYTR